jgi:hypothetical protein
VSWFSWAGGHEEPWRKLIKDVPVEALDEDSGELVEIKPQQDDPNDIEGLLIKFSYTDVTGAKSNRVILCRRCWQGAGGLYVQGFCTLREALRTFRVDRMREVEDVRAMRKILKPLEFFDSFAEDEIPECEGYEQQLLRNLGQELSDFNLESWTIERQRLQRAREACMDGLRVLAYLALADDIVTDQERSIEYSYIQHRLAGCGLTYDDSMLSALMEVARSLTVPSRSFARSLNAIAKDRNHLSLIVAAALRMTENASNLNTIERGALQQILAAANAAVATH